MSLSETLIKSPHRGKWNGEDLILGESRVKNHGEVLTPPNTVSDMLDLVSEKFGCAKGFESGEFPLDKTCLEPACGTGNFLVQVLIRKLKFCKTEKDIFKAVSTIYGVDIQDDNVLESRLRLLEIVENSYETLTGIEVTEDFLKIIADVLENNIILGDTLYKGVQKRDYNSNGDVYYLEKPLNYEGGMVKLTNDGKMHTSPLIDITETYERAYFYSWSWGTYIEKEKHYLVEDDDIEDVKVNDKPKTQADYFAQFDAMFKM